MLCYAGQEPGEAAKRLGSGKLLLAFVGVVLPLRWIFLAVAFGVAASRECFVLADIYTHTHTYHIQQRPPRIILPSLMPNT